MCLAKFITTKNTYWADLTRLPSYFRRKISYYYRVKAIFLIWFPSKKNIHKNISGYNSYFQLPLCILYRCMFLKLKILEILLLFEILSCYVHCIVAMFMYYICIGMRVLDILQTYFDEKKSEIVKFIILWPNFLISKVVCPFFHLIF